MKRSTNKRAASGGAAGRPSSRSGSQARTAGDDPLLAELFGDRSAVSANEAERELAKVPAEALMRYFLTPSIAELMQLPDKYRWEFTRRHPYYVLYAKYARPDYVPENEDTQILAEVGRAVMGAFGITDAYPAGTPYDEIPGGRELGRDWTNGAVFRPTLKNLASTLALLLPQQELANVGHLLTELARDDDQSLERRKELLRPFLESETPELNQMPPLMLSINPHASQRAIVAVVENLVRNWKAELEVGETRPRLELLDETLAVWDLKEGWLGDRYDVTEEKTLAEVGSQLHLEVSEVRRRYAAAFRRIFGRDYDPDVWSGSFAAMKLLPLVGGGGIPRRTKRRPWAKKDLGKKAGRKNARPDRGRGNRRTSMVRERFAHEMPELAHDIDVLLGQGKSDDEILEELELREAFRTFVEYYRSRRDDLGSRRGRA